MCAVCAVHRHRFFNTGSAAHASCLSLCAHMSHIIRGGGWYPFCLNLFVISFRSTPALAHDLTKDNGFVSIGPVLVLGEFCLKHAVVCSVP